MDEDNYPEKPDFSLHEIRALLLMIEEKIEKVSNNGEIISDWVYELLDKLREYEEYTNLDLGEY